jgi:TonB family protein
MARRAYYTSIFNAIRQHWAIPDFLKTQQLEAVLVVVIRRDGKIESMQFEKRSGQPLFDESVERAVRKADPLPPFPEVYAPPKEEIALRFRPQDLA